MIRHHPIARLGASLVFGQPLPPPAVPLPPPLGCNPSTCGVPIYPAWRATWRQKMQLAGRDETTSKRCTGREAGGTRREPADCIRALEAEDMSTREGKPGEEERDEETYRNFGNAIKYKVQGMNRVSGRAGDDKKRSWLLPRQSSIVVGGFARGVDSKVWWWLVVPLRMAARRCRRGGGWHEIGLGLHWHWSLPCPASQRQCQHPPRARCPLLLVIQLRAPVFRPA